MSESKVCVFWDNSNIFIPAKDLAATRESPMAAQDIRIHFDNLFHLAHFDRRVERGICVGSVPPELQSVWDRLRKSGVDVELFERGADSRTEQGVDQALQVHMLRCLTDIRPPGVAVLLTGDGSGYESGVGFHADLERMENVGWGIEVISWDCACKNALKTWAQQVGVYIPLEDYYEMVTFREGTRSVATLRMTKRPVARPK